MPQTPHLYLFTLEVAPLEIGMTYNPLPSHLTLVSRFFSDKPPSGRPIGFCLNSYFRRVFCYAGIKHEKIIVALPAIILLLILGWQIPIKTDTLQGCPGADGTQRHNLILGDILPKINGSSQMFECMPTITHKLYLI